MKIGDKVRFLNEVGGGIVRGFRGKNIALVEDKDGFEIPMLIQECVVIQTDEYNIPLKQEARRSATEDTDEPDEPDEPEKPITYRAPEIDGHDALNVYLAYVPQNIRTLSAGVFDAYLVNDSNYFLDYVYLSAEGSNHRLRSRGTVKPNMKLWLESFEKADLNDLERVAVQLLAYKDDRPFAMKDSVCTELRIDTVKFYKLHTFKETSFFDTPALVYDIVSNDEPGRQLEVSADDLRQAILSKNTPAKAVRQELKYHRVKNGIVEVDLHLQELLDDTRGMSHAEMLEFQLDVFRKTIDQYSSCKGQRLVFIHGKGEGVLRRAILDELKRAYKHCVWQDASFREYGFGATMVTIR